MKRTPTNSRRDDDSLAELVETLELFGPAREHVKTLYFQWDCPTSRGHCSTSPSRRLPSRSPRCCSSMCRISSASQPLPRRVVDFAVTTTASLLRSQS
ncbi:hypothetical protein C9J85_17460 [Haloferax sp. wsp5]|nr:hypothetical protein C9J85_17460 [Haloferax sp. wsp5]